MPDFGTYSPIFNIVISSYKFKLLCTFYRSNPPTTARDDSLTRAKPLGAAGSSGPLRVALPDESSSSKSNKTATVKPFQSPNSKNQNNKAAGGMGDVAAARGNWRPLAMNSSNSNQQVYFIIYSLKNFMKMNNHFVQVIFLKNFVKSSF